MLPIYLVLALPLMAPLAAHAQEEQASAPPEAVMQQESAPGQEERRAVPRGSRPRGDNPQTGTAVPRRSAPPAPRTPPRAGGGRDRGRTTVVRPPRIYSYYYPPSYYYPGRSYPYGYGAFGPGYFYYNPYRWDRGSYAYGSGAGPYERPYSSFDIGELRLQVSPRHAQVFVDGYFAGMVDDYDGAFQALRLESGPYRIELVAPGYDTLVFDVRINPGQKISYRGDLQRR